MALTKITTSLVAVNSLTSANIADNSIDATKIANNQILARHIAAGSISDQLAAAQPTITSLGTLTSLTVDDITFNGSSITDAGNLTMDIGGDLNIDVDGGDINFKDGGTQIAKFSNSSSDFVITTDVDDKDIIFKGQDSTSEITALTLDMSDAGTAIFNNQIQASPLGVSTPSFSFSNDTNTGMTRPTGDTLQFITGGSERVRVDSSGNVGIGETSPAPRLHVTDSDSSTDLTDANNIASFERSGNARVVIATGTGNTGSLEFGDSGGARQGRVSYAHGNDSLGFFTAGSERMNINSNGFSLKTDTARILIEEADGTDIVYIGDHTGSGHGGLLMYNHGGTATVKLTADSHANYINNGNNFGIGTTSPGSKLSVVGPTAASSPYTSDCIEIAPANHTTRTWELRYDDGGAVGNGFSISAAHTRILYLNANGKVGIGTASPQKILHTASDGIRIDRGGGGSYWDIGPDGTNDFKFVPNGSEVARITTDGKVGILDNAPSYILDVNASSSASAFRIASGGNGKDVNCAISNGGTSSTDDTLLALSTANGAGDPYIRMSIAGVEDWHIGVDNSDNDNLHIGRNSSVGSGTKMVVGNQITMKAGGATGQTHMKFNNSEASVADDALIDINGPVNTGCLVAVSSRYRGASVVYCQALYYVDYRSSTLPVLLADPSDAFSNGDVDGKNCLFMNGNSNLRYKNRNGITNYVAITIIEFQGN